MQGTLSHTERIIKLNGEHVVRCFDAEVCTKIVHNNETTFSKMGFVFTLIYKGAVQKGVLSYRMEVHKRFFINEKNHIIKKPNKAQQLALQVATLNDKLEIQVNENFKLIKVINTTEIRKKWQEIKANILAEFTDLDTMVSDFDWQLQEKNIQQLFLEDNFFNFLFSNIFYKDFEGDKPLEENKVISNALGNINIPLIEQKTIAKKDVIFSDVTVKTEAQIAIESTEFPLAKLNAFLGTLADKDSQHNLDFKYIGTYNVIPPRGLVIQGDLEYSFEIKNLYKKTTTINFNLQQDE